MHKFLTEETPGKVVGLLGTALFSLAFMLSVSVSEASFARVYNPLPNPFAPENVVAVIKADPFAPERVVAFIDHAASGYHDFLASNLLEPAKSDYGMFAEGIAWVWDNSKDDVTYALGLDGVMSGSQPAGKVAGAFTSVADQPQDNGFSIDTVYNMLLE